MTLHSTKVIITNQACLQINIILVQEISVVMEAQNKPPMLVFKQRRKLDGQQKIIHQLLSELIGLVVELRLSFTTAHGHQDLSQLFSINITDGLCADLGKYNALLQNGQTINVFLEDVYTTL